MSQSWEWSLSEALGVIAMTYLDDWGRAAKKRSEFLKSNNHVREIEGDITGLTTGQGQPVVFLHGSPGNAMRWAQYLEKPLNDFQFISLDRNGFGHRSDKKANVEQDYQSIKAYVEQLEQPIIVAHSLSGAFATRFASEINVKGLVLVASSIDPLLERVMRVQKLGNFPAVRWILSRSIRNSNAEMIQLPEFMLTTEKILNVNTPVQVIHAKDDRLVPFGQVEYAKKHFKNLTTTELEEGGHFIPWTKPHLVLEAIQQVNQPHEVAA